MNKEFEEWWQTVKDKPGNRYEDAFAAGRALGRREGVPADSVVSTLEVISEMIRNATNHSSCQDCTVESKLECVHGYITAAIEAIPEEG